MSLGQHGRPPRGEIDKAAPLVPRVSEPFDEPPGSKAISISWVAWGRYMLSKARSVPEEPGSSASSAVA
jgi:hypothetical protein